MSDHENDIHVALVLVIGYVIWMGLVLFFRF